jgi:hypothetical protein
MRLLNAYLWGYKNWHASHHVLRKFKEFYPDGSIHIQVDGGGDMENYTKLSDKWKTTILENTYNLGYPGNHQDHDVGRKCWPKESTLYWLDNLYDVCKTSDSKFMIVLEEDSFILKPISILGKEFGISVFEYNASVIPNVLLDVVGQVNGNVDIPLNIFGNKGYGAGGGFIIDCVKWIRSWEYFRPILELNYELIQSKTHLIGWSDCISQIVIMAGGYEVVQNEQMVQTWYHERPDLYPTYTNWKDYEIVDYVKDMNVIINL